MKITQNFIRKVSSKKTLSLVAVGLSVMLSIGVAPSTAKSVAKASPKGATTASLKSIPWQTDYKKTLALAGQQRKWVLIDVYTDTCQPCKALDINCYQNPQIIPFINKTFVCMKADADRGQGASIKLKYGVDLYPCTLVLEPSGKEKGRVLGYFPPDIFPKELARIIQRQY